MNAQTAPVVEHSADAEVGRRVHMIMWDRQLKQTELGPRIGMEQSTLSKKLRGLRPWSLEEVVTVARELHTSVAYLIGEVDDAGNMVHPLGLEPRTHCFRAGGGIAPVVSLFGPRPTGSVA